MQTSSARRSALRPRRFNSATGKRRGFWYSWRALAAGLALALLAGSGIAVAAVGSANAHTPTITYNCQGVHVKAQSYEAKDTNSVTVTIAGVTQGPIAFVTDFPDQFFPFPTSTDAWEFTASVNTTNANPAYSQTVHATSTPCAPPAVWIDVPACTVAGGTVDLTAHLGSLDPSHSYSIALASPDAGSTNIGATDFTPGSTPSYDYVFSPVVPGHSYTVTILDKTTGSNASATKTSVGCPQDTGIDIAGCECTVPGGSSDLIVSVTKLVLGRSYTVTIYDSNNVAVGAPVTVVGDATGAASGHFAVTAGGTYRATIVDDANPKNTSTSPSFHFLPCPKTPDAPQIDPTQCTSTDGTPNSSISFSATNLVPGRTYQVTVSDGTTNVYDSTPFVATASNWPTATPKQVIAVAPGKTYTVTVTDVLLTTFATHTSAPIGECPKLPELTLTPTQCTLPGGTGSIASTVAAGSYVPSRTYLFGLTLSAGGATVVAPVQVVAPANGIWTLPPFSNLPAGQQYRLTLTDTVVNAVSAYADITLVACPGMPSITVDASCNVIGASTINVSLGDLYVGETYTVTVVNASGKTVGTVSGPATTATATLPIYNIPNGNQYTVTVANATNTLTGSTSFYLKNCDLPTLAFTGANPVGPAVAGIGFLQFGLMLVGFGLVKGRRRTA